MSVILCYHPSHPVLAYISSRGPKTLQKNLLHECQIFEKKKLSGLSAWIPECRVKNLECQYSHRVQAMAFSQSPLVGIQADSWCHSSGRVLESVFRQSPGGSIQAESYCQYSGRVLVAVSRQSPIVSIHTESWWQYPGRVLLSVFRLSPSVGIQAEFWCFIETESVFIHANPWCRYLRRFLVWVFKRSPTVCVFKQSLCLNIQTRSQCGYSVRYLVFLSIGTPAVGFLIFCQCSSGVLRIWLSSRCSYSSRILASIFGRVLIWRLKSELPRFGQKSYLFNP